MKRLSEPRKTSNLSQSIQHQLNMYALAAGAAGVKSFDKHLLGRGVAITAVGLGMLATALPAEAKIVYTKADVTISYGNGLFLLDLNHDGIADFGLGLEHYVTSLGGFLSSLFGSPWEKGNAVWGKNKKYASALPPGIHVGEGQFPVGGDLMWKHSSYSKGVHNFGPWANGGKGVNNRYLGFKFLIQGKVHYGWARLNTICCLESKLTGYAYETIANRPIITGKTKGPDDVVEQPNPASRTAPAPQPATLGMLAMGSPSLSVWRRRESPGATQ
jgi:hypothetical protein